MVSAICSESSFKECRFSNLLRLYYNGGDRLAGILVYHLLRVNPNAAAYAWTPRNGRCQSVRMRNAADHTTRPDRLPLINIALDRLGTIDAGVYKCSGFQGVGRKLNDVHKKRIRVRQSPCDGDLYLT